MLGSDKQDQCDFSNRESSNNNLDHPFTSKKSFGRFDEIHPVQEKSLKRQSSNKSFHESIAEDKSARPDSIKKQLSNKSLNQACIDEKLGQINRLSSKLVSKDMTALYTEAKQVMNNSVTDTGVGLPVHKESD